MNIILGNEGIKQLQSYLRNIQVELPSIVKEAENRLGQRGRTYLLMYAPIGTVIDGNESGNVIVENSGKEVTVSYIGEDVAYIEFGTGYLTGITNPYPDTLILNNAQWEYDVNNHGTEGWYYKRKDGTTAFSLGMKPVAPVLNSYLQTKKDVVGVLKEVLNEKLG